MSAYITEDSSFTKADGSKSLHFVTFYADDNTGRRSRASQINAAKRAYERENNVKLTLVSKSYSETYGFLSRSAFRYTR